MKKNLFFLVVTLFVAVPATPEMQSLDTERRPAVGDERPDIAMWQGTSSTETRLVRHAPAAAGTGHPAIRPGKAQRFLGWNFGRVVGPDYLKRFARPPAMLSGARPTGAAASGAASPGTVAAISTVPGMGLRPSLPAGFLPTGAAAGDFNGDGNADWVVANGGSSTLWMYLGRGDGTAEPPWIIPLPGRSPVWISSADLRGTGVIDLVVAEADSRTVTVLLGNNNGTFTMQSYTLPSTPLTLAIGDFTGDGKVDILAGMVRDPMYGLLAVLPGGGGGAFGATVFSAVPNVAGNWIFDVSAADLDGDSDLDVVGTDTAGVRAWLNNGDGRFQPGEQLFINDPELGVTYLATRARDITHDSCPDVLSISSMSAVQIYFGDCTGAFGPPAPDRVYGLGELAVGFEIADVNNDGHQDILATGVVIESDLGIGLESGHLLAVLLGDGQGGFQRARVYRGGPSALGLATPDLNGDGFLDVVTADLDADTSTVFVSEGGPVYGPPDGEYVGHLTDGSGGIVNSTINAIYPVDVDGDGDRDVVTLHQGRYHPQPFLLRVSSNDGSGKFADPVESAVAEGEYHVWDFILADFRNTGRKDFLALSFDLTGQRTSRLTFVPNIGGSSYGGMTPIELPNAEFGLVGPGDFNGDGKLDFVVALNSLGGVSGKGLKAYLGNGAGGFAEQPVMSFSDASERMPGLILVADFNQDGRLDILIGTYSTIRTPGNSVIHQFIGNGDGTFQAPRIVLRDVGQAVVHDINGDGLLDVVAAVSSPGSISPNAGFGVYYGEPGGTFVHVRTVMPARPMWDIGSNRRSAHGDTSWFADFTGDGHPDLALYQRAANFLTPPYLEFGVGNSNGTFGIPVLRQYGLGQFLPQAAADVTGDGRADLIEFNGMTSSFHVIPAAQGVAVQLQLINNPVVGTTGYARLGAAFVSSNARSVTLSSNEAAVTVPASVSIPAGSVTQEFSYEIDGAHDPLKIFTIKAQYGASTAVAYGVQSATLDPTFRLFTAGAPMPLFPGESSRSDAGITSIGTATARVQVRCENLPAGTSCDIPQTVFELVPGDIYSLRITVVTSASTSSGEHLVDIVASDGVAEDRIPVRLIVGDFGVTVTPESQNVAVGQPALFHVTTPATAGFFRDIVLACTGLPLPQCGTSSTRTNADFDITFLTAGLAPGIYDFTLTVSHGSISRSAAAELTVSDFSTSVSTTALEIPVGSSRTVNLQLTSQLGFTEQMAFACTTATGVGCIFEPASGTLPANGSLGTVLTIRVDARPSASLREHEVPLWPGLLGGPALLALGLCLTKRTRWSRTRVFLSALLALSLLLPACGGGGSSTTPGTPPPPPPPPPPSAVTTRVTVWANSPSLSKQVAEITVTVP